MMIHNLKALVSVARQEIRSKRKDKYKDLYMEALKHLNKAYDRLDKVELNEQLDYIEREKQANEE